MPVDHIAHHGLCPLSLISLDRQKLLGAGISSNNQAAMHDFSGDLKRNQKPTGNQSGSQNNERTAL